MILVSIPGDPRSIHRGRAQRPRRENQSGWNGLLWGKCRWLIIKLTILTSRATQDNVSWNKLYNPIGRTGTGCANALWPSTTFGSSMICAHRFVRQEAAERAGKSCVFETEERAETTRVCIRRIYNYDICPLLCELFSTIFITIFVAASAAVARNLRRTSMLWWKKITN